MEKLIDGNMYWLGAIWAKYEKDTDTFVGWNWFVVRAVTKYANWEVA